MDRLGGLVVIAPAGRAGDPGSNPGPGENFSLKLLIVSPYLKRMLKWKIEKKEKKEKGKTEKKENKDMIEKIKKKEEKIEEIEGE